MSFHKLSAVSFTGHRPNKLGGYDEEVDQIKEIKFQLKKHIDMAIRMGYTSFITGMAIGVDTWASEAVLDAKKENPELKLICAIPFKGQEHMWPLPSKKRYWKIVDNADEIHIISEGDYTVEKMQLRNEWMVDHSKVLIAVWNGTKSGTGNCIKYAKKKKAEIWTIDPDKLIKLG